MNLLRFASLLSLVPLAGCSLALNSEDVPPINQCGAQTDCGEDASCVETANGASICAVQDSQLGAVIVEVVPSGAQGSYLFTDSVRFDGNVASGMVSSLQLTLPSSVAVTGRMAGLVGQPCSASDGSIAVLTTLHRQSEIGSFKFDVSAASTISKGDDSKADFTANVPPGIYDIYLEPQPSEGCTLPPPRLVQNVLIDAPQDFEPPEEEIRTLTGHVTIPASITLDGWVLEIVDPTYGHVISDSLHFDASPGPDIAIDGLRFSSLAYGTSPIIRLRDAEGDLSIHWTLPELDLDADDDVTLELGDLLASPMPLQASAIGPDDQFLPSASVVIQSIQLEGSAGNNANYRVLATTDMNGTFSVHLVPGEYAVTIIPQTVGVAPFFGTWEVTENMDCCGKGFQLQSQPIVNGVVNDPLGVALADAPLLVAPSQRSSSSYQGQVLTKLDPETDFDHPTSAWPVRQQVGATGPSGDFQLGVDPGQLDLFVKMPAESGYPWFVIPGFLIDPASKTPVVDLKELSLRYPVIAQGQVSDDQGLLPYAIVRAWVELQPQQGEEKGALVQIGEATTDGSGVFVLPLPPSITVPPDPAPENQGPP